MGADNNDLVISDSRKNLSETQDEPAQGFRHISAENIGLTISNLRKRLNMTQDELAQKLNVSAQAVSKWENGISYPDITLIPKIAECFGVSIDFLFGRSYSAPSEQIEAKIINYLSEVDIKQRYPLAHSFFRAIFDGISGRILNVQDFDENRCPAHAMDRDEGLALLSFKGLGALIEGRYFGYMKQDEAERYANVLSALSDAECMKVLLASIGLEKPTLDNICGETGLSKEAVLEKLKMLKGKKIMLPEVALDSMDEVVFHINNMVRIPVLVILGVSRMIACETFQTGISCRLDIPHFRIGR